MCRDVAARGKASGAEFAMAGKIVITVLVVAGIIAVAATDHWGAGIYAGPLYYLPLALGAWLLSRGTALVAAMIATFAWAMVSLEAGSPYAEPYLWTINIVLQGGVFILVAYLIATLKRALDDARESRSIDAQTGLSTRRSFFERAGSVLAICHRDMRSATLAYVELDKLEQLDTRSWRKNGDAILRELADVMTETLRASDITARMKSNEFVVLLPETGERDARKALGKLSAEIARRRLFAEIDVGISIGAVSFSPAPPDIIPMIKAAEKLLVRVKAAGRNSVIVESENRFEPSSQPLQLENGRHSLAAPDNKPETSPEPRLH